VTDAEEVHVTSGAHQAIALSLAALAGRRAPIAVETPGYPGFFDILEGHRPQGGGAACRPRRHRPRVARQRRSPRVARGSSTSRPGPRTRRAWSPHRPACAPLAAVLDEHDATVIEDATLADLVFAGRPPTDLARLCRRATVVSVGSFSKVLWGGLRVGWLRASMPVIDRTLHRRLAQDLGPSTPSQLLTLALVPHLSEIAANRRAFLAENTARGRGTAARRGPRVVGRRSCRWLGAVGRHGAAGTPTPWCRSPTATASTSRRGRSPSRVAAPTPTCASASTGRGRSSTPGCAGSGWPGASSAVVAASPADALGRRAACPTPTLPPPIVPDPDLPVPIVPDPDLPDPIVPDPDLPAPVEPDPIVPPNPDLPEPAIPDPLPAQWTATSRTRRDRSGCPAAQRAQLLGARARAAPADRVDDVVDHE